ITEPLGHTIATLARSTLAVHAAVVTIHSEVFLLNVPRSELDCGSRIAPNFPIRRYENASCVGFGAKFQANAGARQRLGDDVSLDRMRLYALGKAPSGSR